MPWLRPKNLILVGAILLFSVFASLAYVLFVQGRYVVATLDAGSNREFLIWKDIYFENCQKFFYEIRVNGNVTSPPSFIDCQYEEPTFTLIYSKDRDLVGIVKNESPEVLVAINDFTSGETWPRAGDRDSWEVTLARGRRLKDRLKSDHPQLNLALSDEVP